MDRKRCANDTLRSRIRKNRVISKFKGNSIQNNSDSSDAGMYTNFDNIFFKIYYNF